MDKKTEKAEELFNELKDLLALSNKSQREFTDKFYIEYVDSEAEDSDLEDHYNRYKKRCKRNPDITALYITAFKTIYGDVITEKEVKTAWDFYIEISSRVTCKNLEDGQGDEVAALTSIYQLFSIWRNVCQKHGPKAQGFVRFSESYMDQVREFTTKWHMKVNDESKPIFRIELTSLQNETRKFVKLLKEQYNFKC